MPRCITNHQLYVLLLLILFYKDEQLPPCKFVWNIICASGKQFNCSTVQQFKRVADIFLRMATTPLVNGSRIRGCRQVDVSLVLPEHICHLKLFGFALSANLPFFFYPAQYGKPFVKIKWFYLLINSGLLRVDVFRKAVSVVRPAGNPPCGSRCRRRRCRRRRCPPEEYIHP